MTVDIKDAFDGLEHRSAAYVVAPADGGYLYKGSCRDLVARMQDHLTGKVSRTKNLGPLRLFYHKYFESYSDAKKHELYLKTGHGRAWLKKHMAT